jgi:hypothetical protein
VGKGKRTAYGLNGSTIRIFGKNFGAPMRQILSPVSGKHAALEKLTTNSRVFASKRALKE